MKVLYFSTVWPQLNISAGRQMNQLNTIDNIASVRVFGILESLLKNGAKIEFISSAKKSKLEFSGLKDYPQIKVHSINPNDERETTSVLQKVECKPDFAIFDTFIAEEMFRYNSDLIVNNEQFSCV